MNRVGLLRDPVFLLHSDGPEHVESPDRLRAIHRMLETLPLRDQLVPLAGRDATQEELAWVHQPGYIRTVQRTSGESPTVCSARCGLTT